MVKISYCLQKIALAFLKFYRYCISPLLGYRCRFYPSCSEYAQTAIEVYGIWYGSGKTCKRILKCHPWHPGGYDPVK